ncbi:hypothetical protein [Arundinibacter roseus]|uniref:Uncharacterized protein n=1 Tax=Arundinibacter roseus TaxID=2070510 RepID=A0A4R4K7C6_9BACT|nr:hypothetical protein [Arundinibacter roseus]TDB63370.1 hypothetical protein EZE20_16490 [Arundinibacter roseus]
MRTENNAHGMPGLKRVAPTELNGTLTVSLLQTESSYGARWCQAWNPPPQKCTVGAKPFVENQHANKNPSAVGANRKGINQ